jgi:hypothetical protein
MIIPPSPREFLTPPEEDARLDRQETPLERDLETAKNWALPHCRERVTLTVGVPIFAIGFVGFSHL